MKIIGQENRIDIGSSLSTVDKPVDVGNIENNISLVGLVGNVKAVESAGVGNVSLSISGGGANGHSVELRIRTIAKTVINGLGLGCCREGDSNFIALWGTLYRTAEEAPAAPVLLMV